MVKNKDQLRVENLGMPLYNETFSFGDLYVEFEVIYPKSFTNEQKEQLRQILPKGLLPKVKQTKNTYELLEGSGVKQQ